MHGVNRQVVEDVLNWLGQGQSVWLATIVSTYGASPRPPGSLFALAPGLNQSSGSLSGGCIEDDLLAELAVKEVIVGPELKVYGEDADERSRLLLPCGGSLKIALEFIASTPEHLEHFQCLARSLSIGVRVERRCSVAGIESAQEVTKAPSVSFDDGYLIHVLGAPEHLLILGLGEPAFYLYELAESLDFAVTICEPRKELMQRYREKIAGLNCVQALPDDLIREQYYHPGCAIVALAHDPRVDDMGLIAALDSEAFYVGALGSVRTSQNRLSRLRELGVSDAHLARLHAPIGLNIGSKTPPEIAISIAAELVQARRQRESKLSES